MCLHIVDFIRSPCSTFIFSILANGINGTIVLPDKVHVLSSLNLANTCDNIIKTLDTVA